MPLIKSASKEAVGENIKREDAAGKPRAQSIAIALNTQRRAGGGHKKPNPKKSMHRAAAIRADNGEA
jgi:hypothetical protein